MQVNLSSGNHRILNSGHAFLFGNAEDLTLDIVADNNFAFKVVLKFLTDPASERDLKQEVIDNTLVYSCTNFNEPGTGLTSPINIATIDGRKLYLIFWTYLDGQEKGKEKVRSVRYTIFYEN